MYTILDGVKGQGQYVGTYMAWGVNNNGWWGEGEIKFYLDGDTEYPTICGTGTEDYFCGSYNFEDPHTHQNYVDFNTPYGGLYAVGQGQALQGPEALRAVPVPHRGPHPVPERPAGDHPGPGLEGGRRYLPMQDDIASVAFWYQTLPTAPFPPLGDKDYLEVI